MSKNVHMRFLIFAMEIWKIKESTMSMGFLKNSAYINKCYNLIRKLYLTYILKSIDLNFKTELIISFLQ